MKTFKRALSCFLALLMIFGSCSVISYAALKDADNVSSQIYTKYFVDGEETTTVKVGDTVKARVYLATNFLLGTSTIFWVYPSDFLEFDQTSLTKTTDTSYGGQQFDAAKAFNTTEGSTAAGARLTGFVVHQVGFTLDSMSAADDMVWEGYFSEEFFDDKGWLWLNINGGTPTEFKPDAKYIADDWIAEFTFKVKDTATADGEGYLHIPENSLINPTDRQYGKTAIQRAMSSTDFGSIEGDTMKYNMDVSQDTHVVKLGSAGATKYAVTYAYTGEIPVGYETAPEATDAEEGDIISLPVVTVPAGYRLTWSATGATLNADGTYTVGAGAVAFSGKWEKLYKVTYAYAGDVPEGYTAPAAVELATGETIEKPSDIVVPDGYTLTWATEGDVDGKMGTAPVTVTGTWVKAPEIYNVTYKYSNTAPEGYTAPAAGTVEANGTIAAPSTAAPAGWTLTWEAEGATKQADGSYLAGEGDVEFVGTWAKIEYAVTYAFSNEGPDGVDAPAAGTTTVDATIAAPSTVAPAGWILTWAVEGATKNDDGSYTAGANDVEFVGTWSKVENAVTYSFANEGPDGVDAPAAGSTTVGATIAAPSTVAPSGWTLEWAVEGATKNDDGSYTAGSGAVAFVGTWAKIEYAVTYSFANEGPDGVDAPAAGTTTVGATIAAPATVAPEGWTLEWAVEGATKNDDGSYTAGANDVEFVGTWAKKSYTITYYLSESDMAEGKVYASKTVKYEDAIPVVDAEVEGKTFNNWDYENEAGELKDYTTMPAYNLIAIANLSDIMYTVTFTDVWGDEVTVEKIYGEDLTANDIPDLTEEGTVNVVLKYNGDDLDEQLPLALTGDITIDCSFNVVATFYTEYDEENPENNVVYKEYTFEFGHETTAADFADLGTPIKTGHSLDEEAPWTWEYIGLPMEANTYFVAYWVANEYTATFTAGEGAFAEGTVTTVNAKYGDAIEFTAEPTREGYSFKGWTDVEGGAALDELVMDAEGKTFYPVFVMNGSADFLVELYLMNTEGKYDATPAKTLYESGLIGVTARADHGGCQQYVDDWFSADTSEEAGNVYEGVIKGDGSLVLKLYYKRATYKVSVDGAEATDVYHGAKIKLPETSTTTKAGYTLANWTDGTNEYAKGAEVEVTSALNITANNVANDNTPYTVEIYLMDTEGNYGAAAEILDEEGTTDDTVNKSHDDYAQDAWFSADLDEANKFETVITADGNGVIKLYYARATYKVSVDGAEATDVYHGAKITLPETSTTTKAGYTLANWTDGANEYAKGAEVEVTGALNITANNVANDNTPYTVEIYLMDENGNYGAANVINKEGTTDTTATANYAEYAPAETYYSADETAEGTVTETTITGDGKAVLKLYFKRTTVKITVNGEEDEYYVGEEIPTPVVDPDKIPDGYEQDETNPWIDENGDPVKVPYEVKEEGNPTEIKPNIVAKKDTKYTVEIYLMDTEGNYAETADDVDVLEGTTDTTATAAHAEYAPAETYYSADETAEGTVTETTITGDGKAVLKLYFKRAQYDVTIEGVTTQVFHGAKIKAPATTTQTAPAGFAFAGWNNGAIAAGEEITVTGPVTLEPYFAEGAANYSVEIYLQDANGSYAETASKVETESGKTGETVTIAHADYAQEDYYLADDAQANVFEGTIAGDGSLVLKLYFKRATYDVIVDGEVVAEDVIHGAEITLPEESDNIDEGNELDGWTDGKNTYEPGETIVVDGPVDLTPVQKPSDATKYIISIYVMDTDGKYVGTSTAAYGTTGAIQTLVPDYSREGFTVNTEKSKITGAIAADGSLELSIYYDRNLYTATFDGVDYQVYFGASLPVVEPAAQEGKEFAAWTPAVPATMPAEDLEFTSTWTDVMYKIIYVINGTEEEYEYAYGATVTPIADPVVPGMTFIKWNKTIPTVMPAEDVIIVAEFEAAVFKVTFLDADGNVFDEKAVQYGDTIVLPASNPTKEYHVFKGWIDVPETMPAANVTIRPDFERVPVTLVAAEGSTTVIDRDTMIITGLTTKMNDAKAAKYLAVEGDGYYTLTAVEGFEGYYGTGAKVEVYDNADTSAPIEVYYIVIYGDVNGDSAVNSLDGSLVEDEVLYVTSWSRGSGKDALKIMAADLIRDGKITGNDADSIVNTALGVTRIDQVTGTVVR